jgi:hypothetical protein
MLLLNYWVLIIEAKFIINCTAMKINLRLSVICRWNGLGNWPPAP